ncbi:ATP-binding response regulator [Lacinutrix chionoecetis]
MIEKYNISYKETTNQILLINDTGIIIDSESIIFQNVNNKLISDLHPFFYILIDILPEYNQVFNFECINLQIENKHYTIDATLYTHGKNEPAAFVFHELTKQYVLYQKAAQKRNEAEIKSQLLNQQNNLLEEKETFKNNFITNFSHEIRMPVNTINGFSMLLENTNLEQKQRYNLNIIKDTNDKLKTMINDILDISKIETDQFSIYNMRFNLHEELNILAKIFGKKCEKKHLNFNFNLDTECPKYVVGDKYRLTQIANNLIGNAIKFTQIGTVNLSVSCVTKNNEKATLLLSVEDTGIGIENEQINSIFNGFYQVNNSIDNDGFGLGLAITKKLVYALNGKIELKSEYGKGSTFKVTLDFDIANNQKDTQPTQQHVLEDANQNYKILLAEPLEKNQIEFLNIISKLKNIGVTIVDSGDHVIQKLHQSPFDLVILNLKLPTMDGLDTARYIRHSNLEHFNNIPIVVISENPSKEEEHYCKERRINSYIGKPFNKEEILRKIKYIQQKKQA